MIQKNICPVLVKNQLPPEVNGKFSRLDSSEQERPFNYIICFSDGNYKYQFRNDAPFNLRENLHYLNNANIG